MTKLLVVDDHPLFRDGLTMLLSSLAPSAQVSGVDNCDAALAHVAKHPETSLLFLDLSMPGHSGLSALHLVREHLAQVPVVVLSSDETPDIIHGAIEGGAMGFVPKSSTSDTLMQALQVVLEGGIYLPEAALKHDNPNHQASQPPSAAALEKLGLSARQIEVLFCVLQGKPNKIIADDLALSEQTVKTHVSAVLRALNASSRTKAIYTAASLGIVVPRSH